MFLPPRPPTASVVLMALATLPGSDAAAQQAPGGTSDLTPHTVARVERMLDNRLACRGCHVIAGRGGRIGPALDDVGARLDEARIEQVILDPAGALPGTLMPMQRVPPADLARLVTYLADSTSEPPPLPQDISPVAPPESPPEGTLDGATLYARHCAACHGPSGGGDGWNAPLLPTPPPRHADPEAMGARTDDALYDAVHAGAFVLDGSPLMPSYGATLSPAQIRALVTHIRTLCACAEPPEVVR